MCGIAAQLGRDAGPVRGAQVDTMLSAISHRGDPEHFGRIRECTGAVLGCNRLAIVDRLTAEQPMADPAGSCWVVFNGEIYNHAQLRHELSSRGRRFRTASDTEVLIQGYLEWGDDLPRYLDGIFAFVVYDSARHAFLAARDRFGVKPLYWSRTEESVLFASEMKAFLAVNTRPHEFPAGHLMNGEHLQGYDRRVNDIPQAGEEEIVTSFRHLLENAVKKRVNTDLPIGVIYSGGLDSASVLGIAIRHHPDVTAISVGFPDAPDLEFAERSCRDLGVRQVTRHLSYEELVERLPSIVQHLETFEVIDIMDACVMAPAFETAHDLGIKVVLVGDGSDELLAGYELFRDHPDPAAMMRYRIGNLYRTDLQRVDRLSMLHTVEARVPFLDHKLVDFGWTLPMNLKIRDGIEKWILRKAISDCLPEYLAWRPKIRMPQGTGLLFQLIEFARNQPHQIPDELLRELHLDRPEAAFLLQMYLDCGYPLPAGRYRREGWDFAPNGYFVFQ